MALLITQLLFHTEQGKCRLFTVTVAPG